MQSSRKRIQNNDSEDDPGSWKKNGEDARNAYQRPRRTKEQTEIYNTLRITEANKRIDLEDKMLEITAPKQNTEKKNEKK